MSAPPALSNLLLPRGPFTSHFTQGQCGHYFVSTLSLSLSFARFTRYRKKRDSTVLSGQSSQVKIYSPVNKTNTKQPRRRSAGGAHITGRHRCRRFSRGSTHARRRSAGSTHTTGNRRCRRCSCCSAHPRRRFAGSTRTAGLGLVGWVWRNDGLARS